MEHIDRYALADLFPARPKTRKRSTVKGMMTRKRKRLTELRFWHDRATGETKQSIEDDINRLEREVAELDRDLNW